MNYFVHRAPQYSYLLKKFQNCYPSFQTEAIKTSTENMDGAGTEASFLLARARTVLEGSM